VARHADALRTQRAIWLDAGTRDEHWLDLGAAAVRDALRAVAIEPTHYELFDDDHGGIEYPPGDPSPRRTPPAGLTLGE
jgi:hypothetical protein